MAASRLQLSCNGTNGRARRRLVSLPSWRCCLVIYAQVPAASRTFAWLFTRLPDQNSSGHGPDSSADILQMDETEGDMVNCRPSWQCCLATCQQVYSRPQAIGPALLMRFSSLLGCGPCTGVLSEVFRYLLPGEATAPASVSGAETTSQLQKVVLDPISGHGLY